MLYMDHNDRGLRNIFPLKQTESKQKETLARVPVDTDFSKVIHILSCYCSDVTTYIPSHENSASQSTGKPL